MERLARKEKLGLQGGSPVGFYELEVAVFVWTVDFISDNGVSGVGQMDADLMSSTGFGFGFDQGKGQAATVKRFRIRKEVKAGDPFGSTVCFR
jgi:hypothetical protein